MMKLKKKIQKIKKKGKKTQIATKRSHRPIIKTHVMGLREAHRSASLFLFLKEKNKYMAGRLFSMECFFETYHMLKY